MAFDVRVVTELAADWVEEIILVAREFSCWGSVIPCFWSSSITASLAESLFSDVRIAWVMGVGLRVYKGVFVEVLRLAAAPAINLSATTSGAILAEAA